MSETKNIILEKLKVLSEAKIEVKSDQLDSVVDKMGDDDIVTIVDEDDNSIENNIQNQKLKLDVQKIIDKMNLGQFSNLLSNIDTPNEQAELLASFAEIIGIPRIKLPQIIQHIKVQAENVNPIINKSKLVEYTLEIKNNKK